jgi:hypothetical protein
MRYKEQTKSFYVSAPGVGTKLVDAVSCFHAIAVAQGKYSKFNNVPHYLITVRQLKYGKGLGA